MSINLPMDDKVIFPLEDGDLGADDSGSLLADLRRAWQHRWLALTVMTLVCVSGWFIVALIPNTYEAKARIYLDTQSILGPLLKGLAIDNDLRQVKVAETTRKTLLRRPNLEKVARETDKDLEAKTPEDFERVLMKLADSIEVKGGRRDNIFVILCQDKDPRVAKKVVETLLSLFVESTLSAMRRDTGRTEKFLDDQIAEYRARLEAAEQRLKEFKRENIGRMPTEEGGYFSRLQGAMRDLDEAELQLREAKKKRDELSRQLRKSGLSAGAGESTPSRPEVARLQERIARLEESLDQLRLQYTDNHPDVVSLKNSLAELRKQLASYAVSSRPLGPDAGLADSQAYQELRVSLSEAEANVSALKVRVDEYRRRVKELRKKMATIPEVEARLAQLNRDYEINKKNYESLVARRESASISREAEQSVDTVQFRIIDPPVVPALPVGPNRPVLITLVFLLGLGVGGGMAWIKANVRHTIESLDELQEVVGTRSLVLGNVPAISAGRKRFGRGLSTPLFFLALSSLILVYVFLMMEEILHLDGLGGLLRLLRGD